MALNNGEKAILAKLNLEEGDFHRLRTVEERNGHVSVITKSGSAAGLCSSIHVATRCNPVNFHHSDSCVITKHAKLRKNPHYKYDEEDEGNSIYREWVFLVDIPEN